MRRILIGTSTLALLAASASGMAQAETAAQTAAAPSAQIEEVVVTAEKRREDIKHVPLSLSVLSSKALEAEHVTDFADISRAVPNLSFSSQAGEGLSTLEIRGISSQAGSATVGVYLDDVSLTTRNIYSQGTAEPRFFDIDRVEVLRGPQGTLYGASAMGGVIRFITVQPNLEDFEGSAYSEVSGTSHGGVNYDFRGILNVPIVADKLAVRGGIEYGTDNGYVDLVSPSTGQVIRNGINAEHWSVARLAVKAQPYDNLTITPAIFYQRDATSDIDADYLNLPAYETSKSVQEGGVDTLAVPSLTVNADLGFADLTSITSYYYRRFARTQDGTTVNSAYVGTQVTDPALGAIVGALPSPIYLTNTIRQGSEEIRLASKQFDVYNIPFTYLAGLYYSDEKTIVGDNEPIDGINAAFNAAGENIGDPNALASAYPGDFPNDNSYFSQRNYDTRQYAVFGEISANVLPNVKATVGLRYLFARDNLDRVGDDYFAGGPVSSTATGRSYALTPKFAISWDIDPNNTVYANATKGFRLGSENRPIPGGSITAQDFANLGITAAPLTFGPDKLWNYEIGNKSRFFDNTLQVNTALFYIDWQNIQQDIPLPISGYDYETNFGSAESYGAELDIKDKITAELTVGLSGGYTHATLTTAVANLGVNPGDPVEGSPKWNANLNADYHFEISDQIAAFFRGNVQWIGNSHGSVIRTNQDYDRPSYATVGAGAGVDIGDWEIALFAKNLANSDKVIQQPNIQSLNEGYRLRPLTVGLSASAKF